MISFMVNGFEVATDTCEHHLMVNQLILDLVW